MKNTDMYRKVTRVSIRAVKNVEQDRGIRIYCESVFGGGTYNLQVRASETLRDGQEGKRFFVATAHLDRDALVALRDAANSLLKEARCHELKMQFDNEMERIVAKRSPL